MPSKLVPAWVNESSGYTSASSSGTGEELVGIPFTEAEALEGDRGRPPIVKRLLIAVVAEIDGRGGGVNVPLFEALAMVVLSVIDPAELPDVPMDWERVSDEVGEDRLASVK